jgi:Domain of unknown function (DUF4258)
MDSDKLKRAIAGKNIDWRKHVFQRMLERNITRENVKEVIAKGEMIEYNKNDKPFPSALFLKIINNRPIHVVVAYDEKQNTHIITTYEPTLDIFEGDYKKRKKK